MTKERRPDDESVEEIRRRLEHIGDGEPRRQHTDVVKYGGIADSDADVGDVSRDTYSTPLGPGGTDGPTEEPEP